MAEPTSILTQYWAAGAPEDVAAECEDRRKHFLEFLNANGYITRWRNSFAHYYGYAYNKASNYVLPSGVQGELSSVVQNEYSSLLGHILQMVTQQRIAFQAKAANTDARTLSQTILAQSILEYYLKRRGLEEQIKKCVEMSLNTDWSWLFAGWDLALGDPIAVNPETQQQVRSGDMRYRSLLPTKVTYDVLVEEQDDLPWVIIEDAVSKYDLIAQYPELADQIERCTVRYAEEEIYSLDYFYPFSQLKTDLVPIFYFIHKPTAALPQGRVVKYLDSRTVLQQTPSPYDDLPITRIAPGQVIGRSLGFSHTSHLVGLQDVIDALISAMVSNSTNFALNCVWTEPNSNLRFQDLVDGMTHVESASKPEVLQFAQFSPQLMQLINYVVARAEAISGVSAAARGQAPSGDMSGAAMALLVSQSLSFQSGLQASYTKLIERTGQLTISHLKKFPKSKRTTLIAGKANRWLVKEWGPEDIADVHTVLVDSGNALSQTVSGRLQIADTLLQHGKIANAREYLTVLETGNLDPMTEDSERELLQMRMENEDLSDGKQVPVLFTDNHAAHFDSHKHVLDSPEARKDPRRVAAVDAHLKQHLQVWQTTPPEILMALGLPPPPGMQPGGPPPGAPPGPPGPPGARPPLPPPSGQPPAMLNAESPLAKAGAQVHGPKPPVNPLSHKPFNPENGGM